MKKLTAIILAILIITSCTSTPAEVDETLNPAELFQLAQEASNNKDYETALSYYEVFVKHHSEDIQRLVEAEYEIAFIAFKQGDTDRAKLLFTELLDRYSGEGASVLPGWPMILSRKILKEIENESP
ncbi:MAG: tetratricopeptide repeat protein [Spirochaetales bacterium]|nr:tetratricopeptide repeat protein [Spirochaetales bacterium]